MIIEIFNKKINMHIVKSTLAAYRVTWIIKMSYGHEYGHYGVHIHDPKCLLDTLYRHAYYYKENKTANKQTRVNISGYREINTNYTMSPCQLMTLSNVRKKASRKCPTNPQPKDIFMSNIIILSFSL